MNLDAEKVIEKYKDLLSETTHRLVLLESVLEVKEEEIKKLKSNIYEHSTKEEEKNE